MCWYSIVPLAGISNGVGSSMIASGAGIAQPSANRRGAGISLRSPSGAPASTHRTIVSISSCRSDASFENFPTWRSANHGGIFLVNTADRIAFAQGRASW
jgi:hypothetical protein